MPPIDPETRDGVPLWYAITGAALGYPLGVLGTVCVAIVTMMASLTLIALGTKMIGMNPTGMCPLGVGEVMLGGVFMGIYGGVFVGLFTGGPVFALLAVFRPVGLAWCWVFGLCTLASLGGLAVDTVQGLQHPTGTMSWNMVVYPTVTLLIASPVYMLCTRKSSNLRVFERSTGSTPANAATNAPREKNYYCPDCGYRARPSQDPALCAACGRPRGGR